MKAGIKNLFLLNALPAGLGLLLVGRATAQNFLAWPVTRVAAGGAHTLFTKSDGSLWVMGDNTYGQLGLGPTTTNTNVPTQILNSSVRTVAAGTYHSLFRMGNSLWGMGNNESGQLGDGTTTDQYFPEQIFAGTSRVIVVAMAGGGGHSLFTSFNTIGSGGALWAMGDGSFGQLGDGTSPLSQVTPEQIVSVNFGAAVSAVACGNNHSLFIKPDGSLWSMGYNINGQLGDGTNLEHHTPEMIVSSGVIAVAAGQDHSLFIESDGSLWAMGSDSFGELGDGRTTPGFGAVPNPEEIVSSGVTAVAAGNDHSLFVLSDGSLWAMGDNRHGQLGDGTTNESHVPELIVPGGVVAVAAGGSHSLFIKSDSSLWGMGENRNGELGDGTYTDRHAPVEIVGPVQLTIIPYGADVILTWPTNAVGFNLQTATSLDSQASWGAASPGPVVIGGQNVVINVISNTQQFYRLQLTQ